MSVSSTDKYGGIDYAVSGVNIINGAKILEEKLSTAAIITEEIEAALNINTLRDVGIAEKIMRSRLKRSSRVEGMGDSYNLEGP